MASIVYNGVKRGTGTNNIQTLYTNSTGGNVRILWNYFRCTSNGGSNSRKLFYGPAPSSQNLGHTSGNDLDTIEIVLDNNLKVGKDLAFHVQSQNTYWKMVDDTGHFPLEMMLANTHKICFWVDNQIGSSDLAFMYNFVVIPE